MNQVPDWPEKQKMAHRVACKYIALELSTTSPHRAIYTFRDPEEYKKACGLLDQGIGYKRPDYNHGKIDSQLQISIPEDKHERIESLWAKSGIKNFERSSSEIASLSGQTRVRANSDIRLFLDDMRNPKEYGLHDVVWVKTYKDAIEQLKTGDVSWMSFDNDLGEEKTGYDVAKYIEENVFHENLKCPEWQIHSANPKGRQNIEMAMKSAERFIQKKN